MRIAGANAMRLAVAAVMLAACFCPAMCGQAPAPTAGSNSRPGVVASFCAELRQLTTRATSDCLATSERTSRQHAFIATVPDPKRTNLGLYFDRSIESLIWAGGDVGYSFQAYWFPWSPGQAGEVERKDDGSMPKTEQGDLAGSSSTDDKLVSEPGYLLFRGSKPDDFLVIWIVPESPTAGINAPALRKAADYCNREQPGESIRLIGPTFSGTFESLATTLSSFPQKFRIITGTATSHRAQQKFLDRFPEHATDFFRATVENDEFAFASFVSYLQHSWHNPGEIAILAEDDTVYGQLAEALSPRLKTERSSRSDTSNEKWLFIRFPREIARLRNSYERRVATSTRETSAAQQKDTGQNLPFTLRSPAESIDNVPAFSGQEHALSQEAVLLDIANSLQHEHVRYAAIVATDVLDSIFLARFLKNACPDVRLFFLDSDLLFVRGELSEPLEGMLSVTTYPLFGRNQHWTEAELNGKLPQRIPFSSRYSEGVYNAARAQLWFAGLRGGGEVMLDYLHPDSNGSWHPPLWLAVLGRTAYWPIALLDEQATAPGEVPASSLMEAPVFDKDQHERLHPPLPSRGWFWTWMLVCALAVLHSMYIFAVYRRQLSCSGRWKSVWANSAARFVYRFFRPYPRTASPVVTRFLLIATLAIAAVEVVYLTSGISYVIGTGASIFALILCFAFPACCLLLLLVAAGALGVVTQHKKVAVAAWVLWGLFVLLWTTAVTGFQADMHLFFVAYRMLQPSSGVSPGTPVVFLVVIAFAWAFTQFSREAGTGIPDVPDLDEPLADARRLNVWLMSSFPLAYVSYALLGAVFLIWVRVRGVEGQWYDWLMDLGISFGYFLMLSTWWQLIVCWRHLRRFLEALERHVMRDAFSRLPKELAPLPLVRRGRQKPYLLAAYRCRDTLDAILSSEMSNDDPLRPELDARRTAMRHEIKCLLHLNASEKSEDPFEYDEIENLRTTIGDRILDTANLLVTRAREMFWKEGKSESLEVEQRRRNGKETLAEQQKQRILAEEFIALRFVMYLVFVLDQMRRLMWFVVISFVLIMVAQNVYPFESPRVIDFTSLTIFGIVGIGTTFVLAQMDRDAILSRLTATQPNAIGKNFFIRLVSFGALPLVSVLATQFPSIRNFLFSWIQPALQALTSSG